jgi:hypothetical protein
MAAAFETQALNFSLILNAGLPKIVLIIVRGLEGLRGWFEPDFF